MTATPTRRRPMGYFKLLSICAGFGLAGGLIAALASVFDLVPGPVAYAAAVLVAGAAGLWLSYRWWVGVDEGVREAHKTSWFWGGSTALVFIGAIALGLFGITQGEAAQQFGVTREEAELIFTGIILTVGLLLIGYGVCWAGWWFTRSR